MGIGKVSSGIAYLEQELLSSRLVLGWTRIWVGCLCGGDRPRRTEWHKSWWYYISRRDGTRRLAATLLRYSSSSWERNIGDIVGWRWFGHAGDWSLSRTPLESRSVLFPLPFYFTSFVSCFRQCVMCIKRLKRSMLGFQ